MPRVLVLRPEPAASKTVAAARKLGLEAEAIPLFEVEPVPWDLPDVTGFDGLLLTSANAIRHGGNRIRDLRGLPVYAVGETTAEAARNEGFDIASVGDSGVDRLLGSMPSDLKLLHLAGEHRRSPDHAPQSIVAIAVYRSAERDASIGDLSGVVALIHSPRAGRRLAELVTERGGTAIAAISPAAAEAVGEGWSRVASADTPSDEALLALAAQLCKTYRAS